MSVRRDLWRVVASFVRPAGPPWLGVFALACAGLVAGADPSPAQGVSEQQMRCMQLQQDLAAAQGGGGANRADLANVEKQIAQADRVFQGTQAAMEDAGCFDSFFIFGRGLVRSPKCINMNARVEDARRQLTQLQQQRQVLMGGGGNRRRQAELRDALARSGCGGAQVRPARRGFFDFFGGGREEEEEPLPQTPVFRSIDPGGRYRTVCVRLCDGFFYPIHYATYGSMVGPDAEQCQSSCAAPAELYVYRNPGQEIEQAVSLSGSAYMDLPVALRYRKEYVKGCSCKQAEYNPTDIMAANKQAGIDTGPMPPARAPVAAANDQSAAPVEITGATPPADQAAPPPTDQAAPPPVDAAAPPAPPPDAVAVEQAPPAPKPTTVPQKQKPPAPPRAAAAPPPSDSAEAAPPAPAAPKPSRMPLAPKASPFGQY